MLLGYCYNLFVLFVKYSYINQKKTSKLNRFMNHIYTASFYNLKFEYFLETESNIKKNEYTINIDGY